MRGASGLERKGLRAAGLAALAALCLFPSHAQAAKRDAELEARLAKHIEILASDGFQGREPGTEGEAKTLRYLGEQWFRIGLVSGTNDPANAWFAPVELVAREPAVSTAQFFRSGKRQYVPVDASLVLTSGARSLVRNAPLLFVGNGGVGSLSRNDLAGRVALLLDAGITDSERQNALLAAGASAVLTVLDGDRTIENVQTRRRRSGYALAEDNPGGDLEAFITREGMARLLAGSGNTVESLEKLAERADFAPRAMPLSVTLEATTRETRIATHNLIGKLPGRRPDAGTVLFVAHWDHFGVCAVPPAEDTICNGAIDNASGLATLTEVARKLAARGARPDRDVYFLATTGEELGLLGAHAFAENPPFPIEGIVAAFNIDSNAVAPAGTPFAIVGRGMTGLDPQIEAAAKKAKVALRRDDSANQFVKRQDGWALLQHDIPTVMVSTAYGKQGEVEAFFERDYHRPSDDLSRRIEVGGAADDVGFLSFLARWFGNPRTVPARTK